MKMDSNSDVPAQPETPPASLENINWDDWKSSGRSQYLSIFSELLKSKPETDSVGHATTGFPKALYKLVLKCVSGPVSVDDMCSIVSELILMNVEVPSVIVDILATVDMDMTSYDAAAKAKFYQLCKSLSKRIPLKLFIERYELEPLTDLAILPGKTFTSKFIKVKTRMYFKQNKYNLLREEIEGFSKLIIGIHNQRSLSDRNHALEESKTLLLSLCGWFSLDPARVLAVVLDLFEVNIQDYSFFIPLIADFVKSSQVLFEVILFRLHVHLSEGFTPSSLHQIIVILINNDLLPFEEIYSELEPSEEDMYNDLLSKYESAASDQKVSLLKKAAPSEEELPVFESSQKLGFCETLISYGRWDLFSSILSDWNKDFLLQQAPIARATSSFISYLISPLYEKYSGLGKKIERKNPDFNGDFCKAKPVTDWNEFLENVVPVINVLGPYIYHDTSLIFKLSRIFCAAKKMTSLPAELSAQLDFAILKIIECSFLPALSHLDSNCCTAECIWELLKKFSVSIRYCAYANWKEYINKCPAIIKKKSLTSHLIRTVLKKVSKENVKPMGRIMGKLSHSAPMDLFDQILYQIQMYDSLIGPIVDSLKYLNGLAYDLLGFAVIEALKNDPTSRPKHDGSSPMPWFQNTANFVASLLKRKYPIEITGILKYIVEQLLSHNYIEILVFKEILHKMTDIEVTDEMTDDQIEALGGGECLRGEAAYFVPMRSMKKAGNRLKDALLQEDLLPSIAIIIAQVKYNIAYEETQDLHLKFLGKLYDETHNALLQYGTFLSCAAIEESNINFPSLESMVNDYKITHDSAFYLCRQFLIHQGRLKEKLSHEPEIKTEPVQEKDSADKNVENAAEETQPTLSESSEAPVKRSITKECVKEECIPAKKIHLSKKESDSQVILAKEISSAPLQNSVEDVEEESWGIEDSTFIIPSCDSITVAPVQVPVEPPIEVNETDFSFDYDWDPEDKKTWIEHNEEPIQSEPNHVVACRIEEESVELEEDDEISTDKSMFDIPQIFDESAVEGEEDTSISIIDNDEDSRMSCGTTVGETRESSDVPKKENEKEQSPKSSFSKVTPKKTERKSLSPARVTHNAENGDENEEDSAKDKKLSLNPSSGQVELVNVLLDWVLPSVLTIQGSTSFISNEISPYTSAVFWTLTLYDIHVPVDLYDKEIAKLKAALNAPDHSKDSNNKTKKEQEKIHLLVEKLTKEKNKHLKHVSSIFKRLDETKTEWFAPQTQKNAKPELINVLLHSCILPRVLFSAVDAVYCARFILMLHTLRIDHFSTVLFYDKLLCDIQTLVALCSENEASRFGRFLCTILTDVMRFHSSKEIYDRECANTPGFVTKFRTNSDSCDPNNVQYESYRQLCHKWHYKITRALICLLDTKEYILIRNTIIVLKKILPTFPVMIQLAEIIEKKVNRVKQEEKNVRQDLHTLATSYYGQLKAKIPQMIPESEFHLVEPKENNKHKEKDGKEDSSKEESIDKDGKKPDEENSHSKSPKVSNSKSRSETPKSDSKHASPASDDKKFKTRQNSLRSTSKLKKSHSENKASEAPKTRKKHKSRSQSTEMELKKDKKTKLKRDYSPEPKKSRKKEKKSSKRKDAPEVSEKKHKVPAKSKRLHE